KEAAGGLQAQLRRIRGEVPARRKAIRHCLLSNRPRVQGRQGYLRVCLPAFAVSTANSNGLMLWGTPPVHAPRLTPVTLVSVLRLYPHLNRCCTVWGPELDEPGKTWSRDGKKSPTLAKSGIWLK
ncbi:hypothetical protein P9314_15975, partial [Paenibacillus validus]|nr:hypothetical protein [Paenibacillus validus]